MSKTTSVADAQLKMLMKIAEGDESFFYQSGMGFINQETLRKVLHEQLERMALIERYYVDPRNPAHRIKSRNVANMTFEVEIYMRWWQRWLLTSAGKQIVKSYRKQNPSAKSYCVAELQNESV